MGTIDRGAYLARLKAERTRMRLERASLHLHALGPRAVAEVLAALAERTGDAETVLNVLAGYRNLTAAKLALSGGDRFPVRPLRQVQP